MRNTELFPLVTTRRCMQRWQRLSGKGTSLT